MYKKEEVNSTCGLCIAKDPKTDKNHVFVGLLLAHSLLELYDKSYAVFFSPKAVDTVSFWKYAS